MEQDRSGRPALLRAMYAAIAILVVAAAVLAVIAARRSTPPASHGTSATTPGVGTTPPPTVPPPTTPPTTPPAPPLGHGVQGSSAKIPWSEVGQGWSVADWVKVPSWQPTSPESLFVVDPAGGRYLVTAALPAGAHLSAWSPASRVALLVSASGGTLFAVDLSTGKTLWQQSRPTGSYSYQPSVSGDGQRVLLATQQYDQATSATTTLYTELAIRSGQTLHQFSVPGSATAGYTLPQGLALVVDSGGTLARVSPDGSTEIIFPGSFPKLGVSDGSWLYTPDGSELVIGTAGGLALVYNSGSTVAQLPVPGAAAASTPGYGCQPLSWWSAGVVLATCPTSAGNAYWLVPLSAAAPTRLAAAGLVFGQLWSVGTAVFGLSGACGTTWIDQLGSDGTFRQVSIPGLQPSELVVGTDATQLEVLGELGNCDHGASTPPPASALVWYSPADDTSTFLLGPSVNGGSVLDALAYPEPGQA